MRRATVTIQDVAERSSVSKATVSLVMNGKPGLKPETVERVLLAARELGFTPNAAARRLGSSGANGSRTMMIGFLSDHPLSAGGPDPHHFNVLMGVQRAAHAASYHVLVSMNLESAPDQLDYIRGLSNDGVDGWVLVDSVSKEVVDFLTENQIPKVIAGDTAFFPHVTSIHGDSVGGAGLAARHLIEKGHRRIAFIGGPASAAWTGMRLAGYLSALGMANIPRDDALVLFAETNELCRPWLANLLHNEATAPTAIVAATDWLALETMKTAAALGLSIPKDISLVGFDDAPWFAPLMDPPLTTVHVPILAIGETAFECLHQEIKNQGRPGSRIALPVELIERSSVLPHVASDTQ